MENNCQVMVIHKSKLFLSFYTLQYPKPASDTIVALVHLWGQSQLLICPVYLIILWRYNSLIPLMCLLILADWGMRLCLQWKVPGGTKWSHFCRCTLVPSAISDKP